MSISQKRIAQEEASIVRSIVFILQEKDYNYVEKVFERKKETAYNIEISLIKNQLGSKTN